MSNFHFDQRRDSRYMVLRRLQGITRYTEGIQVHTYIPRLSLGVISSALATIGVVPLREHRLEGPTHFYVDVRRRRFPLVVTTVNVPSIQPRRE